MRRRRLPPPVRRCLFLAPLRHRNVIPLGPVTGANRKRNAQAEFFSVFDPETDVPINSAQCPGRMFKRLMFSATLLQHQVRNSVAALLILPRKQRADPAADAIVLEAGANSGVHHDVRADPVVGIHAHRILSSEVAKVGRNREYLVVR